MAKKKVGLIIIDGLGLRQSKTHNAWKLAHTPTLDNLLKNYPNCVLQASGKAVGLPAGQAGNSEIGHLNIGAGRTVKSELVRINEDVKANKLSKNDVLLKALKEAKIKKAKFHVIGLTSDGGTHSQLEHILRILEACGKSGVKTVLHCLTDGRDCPIMSFTKFLPKIQLFINQYPNICIGTIGGRYYGMDRNQNWDRMEKAVDGFIHKSKSFGDSFSYVMASYKQGQTDEFIIPAYKANLDNKLDKNDFVFIANYRADRVRQLCHMFKKSDLYKHKSRLWSLGLTLVSMVEYEGIRSDIILYPKQQYPETLGKVLADAGLKQLRIAETEKYAHVTFFLDGGKELTYKKEKKILIPSPNVATYDLKPEMSANLITKQLLKVMNQYDVVICNYANCDMVGHTGNLKATIKAVEAVDKCLKQVINKAKEIGMTLFITADHGNCDNMGSKSKPITSHTTSPVMFVSTDQKLKLHNGNLNNIAPTILRYLKVKQPKVMDKKSLM